MKIVSGTKFNIVQEDYITITNSFAEVTDGYLVITKTGSQVKDGIPCGYRDDKRYTVVDGKFVELKE